MEGRRCRTNRRGSAMISSAMRSVVLRRLKERVGEDGVQRIQRMATSIEH